MVYKEMIRRVAEIRRRLYNPANAVPDTGIDLKRIPGFTEAKKYKLEPQQISTPTVKTTPPPSNILQFIGQRLTVRMLMQVVAFQGGIKVEDILSSSRAGGFLLARHAAYWLCCSYFPHMPLAQIGRVFGRDHSSIISGRNRITALMAVDSYVRAFVENLQRDLDDITSHCRPSVPCLCKSDLERRQRESLSQHTVHQVDQAGEPALAGAETEGPGSQENTRVLHTAYSDSSA